MSKLEEIFGKPLEDGNYSLYIKVSHAAENSTVSVLNFVLDRTAPQQIAQPTITSDTDTGLSDSDHITCVDTISLVINNQANSRLYIYINENNNNTLYATRTDFGEFTCAIQLGKGKHVLMEIIRFR